MGVGIRGREEQEIIWWWWIWREGVVNFPPDYCGLLVEGLLFGLLVKLLGWAFYWEVKMDIRHVLFAWPLKGLADNGSGKCRIWAQ